ncbi:fructosamine kinase PKL/CAK/FruK [Russula earlei]|uniref:Fructosamine kinase PKL/CAK/FruK n=1 Tax=Russula earlei TaxID=71964 RepID=A0ACC0ULG3_9AGAM|nr:fructosamine kinase PKL/CAK/FruK [Russula earlei]
MVRSNIPPQILRQLEQIEPGAQFSGALPRVSSSSGKTYFAKAGSSSEREQYVGEAESLRAIALAAPGLAPSLLAFGFVDENGEVIEEGHRDGRAAGSAGPAGRDDSESWSSSEGSSGARSRSQPGSGTDGSPFFISEYKDISPLTERSGAILGRRLATEVHGHASPAGALGCGYGFGVPTFCGATRLRNGWYETWERCFDALIGDLLSTLSTRGGHSDLCRSGQEVRQRVIPALLGPLQIKPVLLHGDLWSGNTGTDATTGEPFMFDPSSFYGHNEADLAIARIFGGIPRSFFQEYHKHMPKTEPTEQYELRGDLYELFHYLNHTVLFGGGYAHSAQRKMEKLLRALG